MTKRTMQSVLVTGGSGFIGSHMIRLLCKELPTTTIVNLDALTYAGNRANNADLVSLTYYHFVHGDIQDKALLHQLFTTFQFDTVIHFAAESHVDRSIEAPLAFIDTNVRGTAQLLEQTYKAWKHNPASKLFFHISTDEVFGSLGAEGHFSESSPYDPRSPYSASKAAADHLVRAWGNTYQLPFIISNCSNNFGPYQFPEKLIPVVILAAIEQRPIPVYGKGANSRDWLHVEEHCEAILALLNNGRDMETYLIGGDKDIPNLELVHQLCTIADSLLERNPGDTANLITFVEDRKGHDFRYAIDHTKISTEIGWHPSSNLDNRLKETFQWYLDHPEWWKRILDGSYRS